MPRPGFVLEVDRSTPPTLFWRGEGVSLENAAAGPQPRRSTRPSPRRRSTTSTAPSATPSLHPIEQDPLPTLLFPGMRADDRLRRRQPAAPQDAPPGRPPARHRGGARPRRRRRRRRRPPDRRAGPAPPDDRGRAAPRRRRPHLRRLRAPWPAVPVRRRGSRRRSSSSAPRTRARRSRSTSGRPSPTCSSTSTSTSSPWTAGGSRPRSASPAYRSLRHHHNPATMEASRSFMDQHHSELHKRDVADGQGARRRRHQGVPDRDDAEHRHVPVERSSSCPSASGSGRPRTGRCTSARPSRCRAGADAAGRARSSTRSRRRTR